MARRRRSASRRGITRGSFSKPLSLAVPAVVGAAGALATNAVVNYAPIPDTLKQGNMIYLTRAAIAIAMGLFGPRLPVVGKYARDMAVGSLIVTATDFGKVMALQQGVNLSGLGYIGPARVIGSGGGNGMGAYMKPNLGAYIRRR